MQEFKLVSNYKPSGDQPKAIKQMTDLINQGVREQTLLGVTGSGKTFSMANVIQNIQKPTLILSHNKTLAAQLYSEFKNFFPENAVHYFVSYFDYYQPEAYIARSDTYIEKDSQINEEIDRLRHAATDALLTRKDVIIVASVSCIYGIGSVEDYDGLSIELAVGERKVRDKFIRQLTDIQYQRNDIDFHRSTFRVRGDVVDVYPASEESAYRIDFFGDEIDRITRIDPLTGEIEANLDSLKIFPGSHYVTPYDKLKVALGKIQQELDERVALFDAQGKYLESQRLKQRTKFDLEMLEQTGFVKGIENYSRYLTNREQGDQPATLLDYYPDDFLMFIDESHMTVPQVRGMYNGDRARKEVLVEHGFRLPSALDNRPLNFAEFERHINQVVYVSATPAQYELERSPEPAQQVIRPTGLLDPPIEVKPVEGQVDDLIDNIRQTIAKRQRVLVTTLTKRMAENLTEYLQDINIKVTYLHSDVDTLDRTDILRDLRLGIYDVVIGINLLREGLDLPEVSLVAILDADKEGFLRSEQALIQTVGRAARHVEGRVIMYADKITGSMRRTIDETKRRRSIQEKYNQDNNISPQGINKDIDKGLRPDLPEEAKKPKLDLKKIPKDEYKHIIRDLTAQMDLASANLQFEKAAELRDTIAEIESTMTTSK
ncbi:excinuclease ABC subunit UvrB [Candidatus Saccharibacteria bacterium]|nr:excinuclease ABC subunit UvrB [Candidatus Saccharibacteria bacterium]